jgi:hypothetical protein
MSYKRNQVIEAIQTSLDDRQARSNVPTRLRRLLHADRLLGRSPRSSSPEQSTYVFFSGKLAGSGNENLYSPFEAFALFLGIRLLENGFPQRVVVRILRRVRSELESGLNSGWRLPGQDKGTRCYLARIAPQDANTSGLVGSVSLCRGESAVASFLKRSATGQIMTVMELSGPIARFKDAIDATLPIKRGRH